MSEDSQYKALLVFISGLEDWPFFKLKFCMFLAIKKLLYVIESLPTESENLDSLWEEDDLKVKFFLINKPGIQAVQLVADFPTAFQMISVLEAHYATNSIQAMVSHFDRLLDME